MNKTTKRNQLGRLSVVASASALIALPLLAAGTQAAPPSHAPAHGYYKEKHNNGNNGRGRGRDRDRNRDRDRDDDWRNRDGDWRNRDGDWRNRDGDWRNRDDDWRNRDDDWRNRDGDWRDRDEASNDGNPSSAYVTWTGTVIRTLSNGRFEARHDDGRMFTVRDRSSQTSRVRVGQRVELAGYLSDRNIFLADSVRVIGSTGNGYNNANVDFYGTVLSASSRDRLTVRADNGQTFYVTTRNSISSSINRGDRVRVTGYSTNRNVVSSATVVLVSNNGGTGNSGQTVNFTGTVQTANSWGGVLVVRGDNGRSYNVRTNNNSTFQRGQRVRVVGRYSNGIVYATSVTSY